MIDVTETDFAFDVADEVPGGVVRLRATNAAKEDHQASLIRLAATKKAHLELGMARALTVS